MIDRICVKVQDHLNSLRNCGVDAVQEDVKSAERLMRDAKNSKTVSLSQHAGDTESGSMRACSFSGFEVLTMCHKRLFSSASQL